MHAARLAAEELRQLRTSLVLVCLAAPAAETELRGLGHHVVVEDEHRLEPNRVRRNPTSARGVIEQLETLVGRLDKLAKRDARSPYATAGLARLVRDSLDDP